MQTLPPLHCSSAGRALYAGQSSSHALSGWTNLRMSSRPDAMTVARPAWKCQKMWQWKNHGPVGIVNQATSAPAYVYSPGLSVLKRTVVPAAPTPAPSRRIGSTVLISSEELDLIRKKLFWKRHRHQEQTLGLWRKIDIPRASGMLEGEAI